MRLVFNYKHLAGPTGFEPAISSVTGRRDRPTSLRAQDLLSLTILLLKSNGFTTGCLQCRLGQMEDFFYLMLATKLFGRFF